MLGVRRIRHDEGTCFQDSLDARSYGWWGDPTPTPGEDPPKHPEVNAVARERRASRLKGTKQFVVPELPLQARHNKKLQPDLSIGLFL
jgi:hypothetical protein